MSDDTEQKSNVLTLIDHGIEFNAVFLPPDSQDLWKINIYDNRYPFSEYGQLISSYRLETILEINSDCPDYQGINLYGGEPNWYLSKDSVKLIQDRGREILEESVDRDNEEARPELA